MSSGFEPLYTAAEMRAAEERYPGYPDSIPELMERAGTAVAREALVAFPEARRFGCVCGGGSNGGDGRVAARVLREAGREADETDELEGYDVVVDALFGTGFHGEPRPEAAALIERMNAADAPVLSIDLPSGVDASTGEVAGAVVDAELTVTFHALKAGLVVAPGRFHAGRVVVADIGLEPSSTEIRRATAALLRLVPLRREGDTKYRAGAVVVVGGQPGMTGAAALTARAAFRADAGYVALAVPEASLPVVETLVLEAVKTGWSDDGALDTIAGLAERAGAIAIGPGLGRGPGRRALVRAPARTHRPAGGRRRRRALRARARRARGADRADPARGGARRAPRDGLRLGGRAPAGSGAEGRRDVRRRRAPEGPRLDRCFAGQVPSS